MSRLPRVYLKDAVYYVTCLAGYNESLFKDSADYNQYLGLLHKYEQDHGFKLFAFVLLPKEIQLLIEDKNEVTISAIMHNLNSAYTKIFNSRYDRKGHLFQGRFKSVIIEKKEFLPRFIRFIHTLPLRLGLTTDLGTFVYAGHCNYLHSQEGIYPQMKEAIQEVLNNFSPEGSLEAWDQYVKAADPKEYETIQKLIYRKYFVGSPEFIRSIQEMLKEESKEEKEMEEVAKIEVTPATNRISERFIAPSMLRSSRPAFVILVSLFIACWSLLVTLQYSRKNFPAQHSRLAKIQNTAPIVASSLNPEVVHKAEDKNIKQPAIEIAKATSEDLNKSVIIKQNEEIPVAQEALNGSVWQVTIMAVGAEKVVVWEDELVFQDGKVVSTKLAEQGYDPSECTVTRKEDGSIAWQTALLRSDGSKVSWYGVWRGQKMRGVLSERPADSSPARNYTFVSIKNSPLS